MRLDAYAREFGPYTDELDEALADGATRLYIDTSLLMWLIRIGREARGEFIGWCNARQAGTVRVPVWAAHELHRHLIRGTIASNVHKLLSETEKKIVEFAALANESADDLICQGQGYADRSSFVSMMEQTVARVKNLSNVIRIDQHMGDAADQVVAFVNDHLLDTDLEPIVDSLNTSGEFRFSHLMPPGYLDRKDENKFGDVVIWEEMLADLPRGEGAEGTPKPNAILLSRDEKTDWVSSAPAIRQDDTEKPSRSNRALGFDVTRPHPLLVHEFSIRSGGSRLYVVHPGVFAAVLDYGVRKHRRSGAVTNLLAAAYRPEFLDRLAVTQLAREGEQAPRRGERRRERDTFIAPPLSEVMAVSMTEQLRTYIDATPPDQSALAHSWTEQLLAGTVSPIQFGRLAAELAQLDRPEWRSAILATLEQLTPRLTEAQLNLIVLAIVFTAYFDRYAEPLRQPRSNLVELALALEIDGRLTPAFTAVASALADKEVELPYVPGSGQTSVAYHVDLAPGNPPRLVRDIRIGEQSVLQNPVGLNETRLLSTLLTAPGENPTGKDLRALLARSYFIPFDRLDSKFDKQKITWSPAAGLVTLDTSSPGGLSAAADDGDDGE
jgi:hypothetical protein